MEKTQIPDRKNGRGAKKVPQDPAREHKEVINPPTERRVGIARILLEIAREEGHIDKDLVRSICGLRTGKQYLTAGAALADLSWIDAERVWFMFQEVYTGKVQLEYITSSNEYTITKENTHVR